VKKIFENGIVKTERTGPVIFSQYKKAEALKKALKLKREEILFEVKASGLKGRGGAGFPTSTKWMLTAAAKADKKFVICNADEGEPGTFKDRVLLMEYPELVFEGMDNWRIYNWCKSWHRLFTSRV